MTERLIKRLFIKLLLFQAGVLIAAVIFSIALTAHFKYRLGSQLTAAFRNDLLIGDTRKAMLDLPGAIQGDFDGIKWNPAGSSHGFNVPEDVNFNLVFFYDRITIQIYFDERKTEKFGDVVFYYHRWTPILWALGVWFFFIAVSIPIWFREKRRIVNEYDLSVKAEVNESRAALAAQVAHDIRSPLAALGAAAKGLEITAEQRKLMEGAVDRMQGIADDLLQRYRASSAGPATAKTSVCALAGLIEQVLAEKRLQHKEKTGVKIEFNNASGEIKALVEPKELQRLLSNLVNNSVEAFAGPSTVSVDLSAPDGKVVIEVKDNGKGIPPGILAKLGQKGETHGKTGGTGLGLYHARTTVEGWGGSFKIGSEPGKGTTVRIELPRTGTQAVSRIAVLLDDDMLVHMNWKMAAKAAGVELKAYKTCEDFAADMANLPKDEPVYIDSDLGNDIKGEDIAKDLHEKGFTDISMATGHGADQFTRLPWLKVTGKEPPWA